MRLVRNFDAEVGVVGAGPAGARAAELFAARGTDVLLFDPRAPWEKPCGGGLTASVLVTFPEVREILDRAQRITALRFEMQPGAGFAVGLSRPLYILSRLTLSRWQLSRAVEAGAVHERRSVKRISPDGDGWRLETEDGREWRVRLLVGADGAASLVRRVVAPDFRVELDPTRVAYVGTGGTASETAVLKFYPGVKGYLWDFPRPDHRSVGAGVAPGSPWNRSRFDREIDAYRASLQECLCVDPPRAGAVIGSAGRPHRRYEQVGGRNFALLGDAAGFADPCTGEGIHNALRSAGLLVETYEAEGSFAGYPARARAALEGEFRAARLGRRILFDWRIGPVLIRLGVHWKGIRALTAAVCDAVNEHDGDMGHLARRWWRHVRNGVDAPTPALPPGPAVCTCGCGGTGCESVPLPAAD